MAEPESNKTVPNDTKENGGTKDPTVNVQNLLNAAVVRQNDLRDAEIKRIDERTAFLVSHLELRISEESTHTSEVMALRSNYERQLAEAEAKRIDAIRVVDVNAVNVANERAVAQAGVLANQVSSSAEILRGQVAAVATTLATQLSTVTGQLSDRITILERSNNIGQGREQYTDPLMTAMVAEIKTLNANVTKTEGKGLGANALWGYIVGAIGVISVILAIISRLAQ